MLEKLAIMNIFKYLRTTAHITMPLNDTRANRKADMTRLYNVLLLILFSLPSTVSAQDYLWPTDASKLLTSNFCEFRPRHYHAGIDIKTWAKTGFKIYAIEDGYVYRIRVAATGYGKAVYIHLKDGNYVVYAHLQGFTDELDAYTDSVRTTNRSNILDHYPKPTRFPVKKGDFLGYTGETGIGVPHLHFEIRNASHHPINPLRFYLDEIEDTITPKSKFMAVIPQSSSTLVNFQPDTLILPVKQSSITEIKEPIYLTGDAYIALRSFDMANGASNGFDLYRGEMLINDSTVYTIAYNKFNYNETRLIEIDKNFSLHRKGYRVYHNFYRHPANSLPFYKNTPRKGGLLSAKSLRKGENKIVLRVYDYHNNKHEISLTVVYYDPVVPEVYNTVRIDEGYLVAFKSKQTFEAFEVERLNSKGKVIRAVKNAELEFKQKSQGKNYYHVIIPHRHGGAQTYYRITPYGSSNEPALPVIIATDSLAYQESLQKIKPEVKLKFFGKETLVKSNVPLPDPVSGEIRSYQYRPFGFLTTFNPTEIAAFLKRHPEFEFLTKEARRWSAISPKQPRTIRSEDGVVRVEFGPNATYDSLHATIWRSSPTTRLSRKYPYLTDVYAIEPFDAPLDNGARLRFKLPGDIARAKGTGIYYKDRRRKSWKFLPTEFDGVKNFSAKILSLEKFVAIRDTIPPTLRALNLSRFNASSGATERLSFSVRDEMSGIYRETQIQVRINGRWSLFEYDPEERLVYVHRRHIPKGNHVLQITVTDNAGNSKTHSFNVTR